MFRPSLAVSVSVCGSMPRGLFCFEIGREVERRLLVWIVEVQLHLIRCVVIQSGKRVLKAALQEAAARC